MFAEDTPVHTLYDYVWRNRDPAEHFYMVNSETKEKLLDLNMHVSVLTPDNDLTVFVTDMWDRLFIIVFLVILNFSKWID